MPRGVYERKKSAKKSQPKGKVKVARPKKAPAKALPKAGAALALVVTTPAAALAGPAAAPPVYTAQDFRGSVDDMGGDLLRAYARRLGIQQRDVDGLTEDRLRQNCKVRALQIIEDA